MSVPLIVGGVTYNYPVVDTDEGWGVDATDWAIAVTEELSNVVVSGDIGPTTLVVINNNQAVAANVTNFVLDPALIRSATAEYYVYRTTTGPTAEVLEAGTLYLLYSDNSSSWTLVRVGNGVGTTGVEFTITALGQLQYTSSNLAGTHTGRMKYRVRVLQKI